MANEVRTTIAVLATALFLGAISAGGALTHVHATSSTTTGQTRPAVVSAPHAIPFPESESMTND